MAAVVAPGVWQLRRALPADSAFLDENRTWIWFHVA
jgi:hypothetical protein